MPKRRIEAVDLQIRDDARLRIHRGTQQLQAEQSSGRAASSVAGDDKRRELEIDWLLRVGTGNSKRKILKFTVERRGRGWKITSLDAVEFFSRDPASL